MKHMYFRLISRIILPRKLLLMSETPEEATFEETLERLVGSRRIFSATAMNLGEALSGVRAAAFEAGLFNLDLALEDGLTTMLVEARERGLTTGRLTCARLKGALGRDNLPSLIGC